MWLIIPYDTFRILNILWIGIGVSTFFLLIKINAPYGRHTSFKWGPLIDNRVAWFIMEVPVLIAVAVFSFVNNDRLTVPLIILATLFCAHYLHRSIIFPLRLRTRGKKMPVVITASAIVFNLVNGFFIGYFFRNYAHYELSWLQDKRFLLGIFFFVAGAVINLKSDTTLIRLRGTGETGYKIPKGFLFDKVSCPNHFGEILEWMGFAVMCWNLPALGFFIWTVANLVPRSLAHHQWYHEKFANYPANRRAIIPYLL